MSSTMNSRGQALGDSDEEEIGIYEGIVEFANNIIAGVHPRIKRPQNPGPLFIATNTREVYQQSKSGTIPSPSTGGLMKWETTKKQEVLQETDHASSSQERTRRQSRNIHSHSRYQDSRNVPGKNNPLALADNLLNPKPQVHSSIGNQTLGAKSQANAEPLRVPYLKPQSTAQLQSKSIQHVPRRPRAHQVQVSQRNAGSEVPSQPRGYSQAQLSFQKPPSMFLPPPQEECRVNITKEMLPIEIDFKENYYKDLGVDDNPLLGEDSLQRAYSHKRNQWSPYSDNQNTQNKWADASQRNRLESYWERIQKARYVLLDPILREMYEEGHKIYRGSEAIIIPSPGEEKESHSQRPEPRSSENRGEYRVNDPHSESYQEKYPSIPSLREISPPWGSRSHLSPPSKRNKTGPGEGDRIDLKR